MRNFTWQLEGRRPENDADCYGGYIQPNREVGFHDEMEDVELVREPPGDPTMHLHTTARDGAFQACWNLVIDCRNGGEMTGPACHDMAAGESQGTHNMPVSGFSGQESCDVPASGKVEQLRITST